MEVYYAPKPNKSLEKSIEKTIAREGDSSAKVGGFGQAGGECGGVKKEDGSALES